MPRLARIVVPGVPHHITQRGNNRQQVFFEDAHRHIYLDFLSKYVAQFGVTVWSYCLMTNHVHIVATPPSGDALAKAIGRTNFRYAQHLNRLLRRSGHLWQNRFSSCPLDEVHHWRAMRYVERNPVRAGLVRVAWRYAWSSAAAHVEGVDRTGLLEMRRWARQWKPGQWEAALRDRDDEGAELVCGSTRTGRPLGSEKFVRRIEKELERRVRAMPVGRPKTRSQATK